MKFTDKLISMYGKDKLLHLTVSGWVQALSSILGIIGMLVTSMLLILFSIYKEYRLDNKPDIKDILFSLVGIMITWIFYIINILIF